MLETSLKNISISEMAILFEKIVKVLKVYFDIL
jgi:hypothetical protein